jgi:transcriptional regulator of NAD metabolism
MRMTPYLERFADKLPELEPKIEAAIDAFQTLTDAFIDHPIAGNNSYTYS